MNFSTEKSQNLKNRIFFPRYRDKKEPVWEKKNKNSEETKDSWEIKLFTQVFIAIHFYLYSQSAGILN
jgi:hypothetical protein